MTNTVLQLDNVEFRRNRRVIITDVNLTINAGERWVLFGPNGIGKSTAVGMLATRTFPSEGRVFILGHQLGKYDVFKLRTRIGLASADLGRQFPEFEDPLPVRRDRTLARYLHGRRIRPRTPAAA